MIYIAMLRHGITDWNQQQLIQGHSNRSLSDEGKKLISARKIPEPFFHYDCHVSPLKRAQETAHLLGLSAYKTEDAIIEMNWGDWEGKSLNFLEQELGEAYADNITRGLHFRPTNGESPWDVQTRLKSWLQGLNHSTLAITHKGVIRSMLSLATGWKMDCKPPYKLDWDCLQIFSLSKSKALKIHKLNQALLT